MVEEKKLVKSRGNWEKLNGTGLGHCKEWREQWKFTMAKEIIHFQKIFKSIKTLYQLDIAAEQVIPKQKTTISNY